MICPLTGASSPKRVLSSVVLPEALSPHIPTLLPWKISIFIPLTKGTLS